MMPHSDTQPTELTPLGKQLAARIAAGGPISYHDYIEACLYDPEHGYYRNKDPLGRGGDFITAPEISQIFGELIGLWSGEVWRSMGQPAQLRLIELGPGRGTLMADALRALRVLPGFLPSVTVHLVETSKPLRNAQEATLAKAGCSVFWHDSIADVPEGPSIIIANEFFDCLPVRQFKFDEWEWLWHERMVSFEEGDFRFRLDPNGHDAGTSSIPFAIYGTAEASHLGDDAIVETRPAISEILGAFGERTAKWPFAALIIDYGYALPSFGDTVQAVRHHKFADTFEAPGECDLTAHVDFAHLTHVALEHDFAAFGPMPMGEWLLRLGLEARLNQLLRGASAEAEKELRSRVSRLIDPAQMGALFKVVALTRGVPHAPVPFS